MGKNKWLAFAISGPILALAVVVVALALQSNHPGERPLKLDGQVFYSC